MMKKRKFGAGGSTKRPMPTPADRAASKAQDAMLKKVTPTKSEAKTLASVRRVGSQEGAEMRKMGMKRGGMAKKRYAEGGMASAGLDLEAKARRGEMERELGKMDFSTPKVEAPAKKESFSAAFAAARKRGDKTFTWKGGSYGTKMKGDGDKPTKANKPSTPTPTPTPTATPSKPAPAASAASAAPAKPASGPPRTAFSMRNETPEFKAEASRRTKLRTIRGPAKPKTKETETKTPASNAARTDFDTKAGRAGIGIMLERPPRSLKYAKGGSVTRGDGAIRKGKTKGRII